MQSQGSRLKYKLLIVLVNDLLCCSLWLADARVSPETNEMIIIDVKAFMRMFEIANEKYYVIEF